MSHKKCWYLSQDKCPNFQANLIPFANFKSKNYGKIMDIACLKWNIKSYLAFELKYDCPFYRISTKFLSQTPLSYVHAQG